MSFDPTAYARSMGGTAAIPELSRIALTSAQASGDGRELPAGSLGTIVGTWARGAAYVVEFTEPFAALVTLEPAQFRVTAGPAA